MTIARSIKNDHKELIPAEIWIMILQHIEPIFLQNVMLVCRDFHSYICSDAFFKLPLNNYYPDSLATATPAQNMYTLFKQRYIEETQSLTKSARKLLDLISYQDLAQINLMNFDPEVLLEKTNGATLLFYLNKKRNQAMRNLVFEKIHRNLEKAAEIKANANSDFISLLLGICYYKPEMLFAYKTKKYKYSIKDFAIALNQLDFIKKNWGQFKKRHSHTHALPYFSAVCFYGHIELAMHFLVKENPLAVLPTKEEEDPLVAAVQGDNVEMVDFLLTTQRNNFFPPTIERAALCAVDDQKLDILELFLMDADITEYVYTLLVHACKEKQTAAGKLIYRTCEKDQTLLEAFPPFASQHLLSVAACAGSCDLVEYLLNKENDIPRFLIEHPELLMDAIESDSIETLQYLLHMGADPNSIDEDATALHIAAECGNLPAAELLLQAGADISAINNDGETAFELAKENQHEKLAHFLLKKQWQQSKKRKAEEPISTDAETERPNKRLRR